ncbi:putative D123 [Lyophyllum shimeji]|uniref:D123 n=1 Tax=Lyophyllum shimeji TaxID=47721 RepID=A0A9P3PND0_LYOSH|nr:putative D123 [Lyophyllum shimeji]
MSSSQPQALFPPQTPAYILSFQFSSWYPHFSRHSIKSTIIRPLTQEFRDYLDADGVFVPEGSEDVPVQSALSDDEESDEEADQSADHPSFAFPEMDTRIRDCVQEYGAVFPKLNFSSPKDASWILPSSSPLKCTSPSDVYMLLKSSDFITHDLSTDNVFEGCEDALSTPYDIELVLRKWYPVDCSRELRCFVRQNVLVGVSQRDTNYYEFLNEPATYNSIAAAVQEFWEKNIRRSQYWQSTPDYTFDFLLTRDLSRGHILDFNPYAPRTDPLLFTYEELAELLEARMPAETSSASTLPNGDQHHAAPSLLPEFRVIDSRAHPAATSSAPAHQHNMVPFEALSLSSGRDIEEFANIWKEEIRKSAAE